jgi:integrase
MFRLQPDQFVGRLLVFIGDAIILTDTEIRGLKPRAKPYKVSDSGGLHVLVMPESSRLPKGSKLWKCSYRFAGRQKTLSFGAYPDIGLGDARGRREVAKLQLRQGIDPGGIVKTEKQALVAATANTFSAVSDEWFERKIVGERKSGSTLKKHRILLAKLKGTFGDRPISEIEAPELLAVLRRVEAAGHHETVGRLRSTASRIFRYGIATGRCSRDIAADLQGATTSAVSTPRAAVTDPVEVGKLLRAIDGFSRPLMQLALKLLALMFVRPGELLAAEWSEIDVDVWSIPPEKSKMRRAHHVPLSRQTLEVLAELRQITGHQKHLLASPRRHGKSIAANQFNYALREMGFTSNEHVAHGFRAMASTILNESGKWPVDVIELQLAHVERNKVRRAYNRAERWTERVALMQWWADHLDGLRERGGVVPLPKKAERRTAGA